ncbi:hypothetical protein OC861_000920 [Tilletia horrida]|nr:hypothetical protein OC861_000920 [Tilletia horrida]
MHSAIARLTLAFCLLQLGRAGTADAEHDRKLNADEFEAHLKCVRQKHAGIVNTTRAYKPANNFHRFREMSHPGRHGRVPATTITSIGEVTLYNDANQRYYTVISIGNPPVPVTVQVDTGSSDLWVTQSAFSGANASSTFISTNRPFIMNYTDGSSVAGYQGSDLVTLAGYEQKRTAISVGIESSPNAAAPPVSGVLGMGWPALATGQVAPLWASTGANVFSLYLTSSSDVQDKGAYGGVMTLGGPDPSFCRGGAESIKYVPLLRPITSWTIPLSGISVQNTSIPLQPLTPSLPVTAAAASPIAALIDSGTTLMSGSTALVQAFYAAIPGSRPLQNSQGFYEYPCDSALNVTFSFGSERYMIPDQTFARQSVTYPGAGPNDPAFCMGSLFDNGGTGPVMILGDTFLRSVYTIFDGERQAIGFAPLADNVPAVGPGFALAENATGSTHMVAGIAHDPTGAGTSLGSATGSLAAAFRFSVLFTSIFILPLLILS